MSHQVYSHTLPSATPGTQRVVKAHHFGELGSRPKIYLQAGLHADEWPGFLVLNTLIKKLIKADEKGLIKGEIIIVPVANPIGLGQNFHGYIPGRFAFSDGGGNFNRNWPQLGDKVARRIHEQVTGDIDQNMVLVRQAIRQELMALPENSELQGLRKTLLALSMDADEVIDLHCSGEACMHAYVAQEFETYFTPLLGLMGADVALSELETGAHSFDETNASVWRHLKAHYAHLMPWGCRSLTLELRGENDISHDFAEQDASALMKYFIHRQVVEGKAPKIDSRQVTFYPLDAMDLVKAPVAGIACFNKSLGEAVEAGEVIGEVVDLMADDVMQSAYPLIARADGVFFARFQRRLVVCGESIAKIAGREHLAFREIGHLFED